MKKLVKIMAALLMLAGVVGFMGCQQATGGESEQNAKPDTDVINPEEKPTPEENDCPKFVRKETIAGKEYDIVEFGIWPQTKYSGIAELQPCEKSINAWEQSVCFTDGTDNYIKVTATPDSSWYEEFTTGSTYYFKLEPIQWRVLTNDYKIPDGNGEYKSSNNKLLFAEKTLVSHKYHDSSNKYDTSDIRTYLNGDFINKAFTPAEIAKIPETNVDNSAASTFGTGETGTENQYACDNTTDKIFLLSEKEITTAEYGFDVYNKYGTDSTRIRKTTDYARATGAWVGERDYKGNSAFWLRSPSYQGSDLARDGSSDGRASYGSYVNYMKVGVVPALSMTF